MDAYDKWNTQRKKGYLKIHVAVNVKTKEILALEKSHWWEGSRQSKMLKKLVNHVLKINPLPPPPPHHKTNLRSVLADGGAHDTNRNFTYLEKNRIISGIKVRKNSIVSLREITS